MLVIGQLVRFVVGLLNKDALDLFSDYVTEKSREPQLLTKLCKRSDDSVFVLQG